MATKGGQSGRQTPSSRARPNRHSIRIVGAMHTRTLGILSWTEVLAALRRCTGASVLVRDGRVTEPAAAVRNRAAAKGTELCLFTGDSAIARLDLVEALAGLSKSAGRRFMTSARANISDANLLVDGVADETIDGTLYAVINTRRPKLGFNQSQQVGATTTLRSKRIKNV